MVLPSRASELVEGLCVYARDAESFCPYRVVIGGCPPWFDQFGLILGKKKPIGPGETEAAFKLWGHTFVERQDVSWDWMCCPFRRKTPEAAF